MVLGGDQAESGLYGKSLEVLNQIRMSAGRQRGYNGLHETTWLDGLNPADYVILNAQRRQKGESPLDSEDTFTAFVELPVVEADKAKWIGSADNHTNMLWFNGLVVRQPVGRMQDDFGVRFTVRSSE
jgi:hypothetical protein